MPGLLACFPVETNDLLAIVEINPARISREGKRSDAGRLLPELLPRASLVGDDAPRLLIPDELGEYPALVPNVELRNIAGQLGQLVIGKSQDQSIGDNHLLGGSGVLIDAQGLSGHRIDFLQWRYQAAGHVNSVTDGDEAAGELGRTALERPEMVMPFAN